MIYALLAVAFVGGVYFGSGPLTELMNPPNSKIEPLVEFNMTAGKWYEVETSGPRVLDCVSIEFKLSKPSNLHAILEGRIVKDNLSFRVPTYSITREPDVDWIPKLKIRFPPIGYEIDFLIYAVDFNWFLVLSVRKPSSSKGHIRILTRDQNPTEELMKEIHEYNAMMEDVASLKFNKTNQSACIPNPTTIIPESVIID